MSSSVSAGAQASRKRARTKSFSSMPRRHRHRIRASRRSSIVIVVPARRAPCRDRFFAGRAPGVRHPLPDTRMPATRRPMPCRPIAETRSLDTRHTLRLTIRSLIRSIASVGLSPLGHTSTQFMIEWQRNSRYGSSRLSSRSLAARSRLSARKR